MNSAATLRLGVLTGQLSSLSGGFAVSVPGLAKALGEISGVECHVLGLRDPQFPNAWRSWGRNVHPLESFGPRPFGFARMYASELENLSFDVTDAQGLWMYHSLVNLRISGRTGAPYVVTPRGMLDPWSVGRSVVKKRLVSWCFEAEHLRRAACLRATAPMEAAHFRAYGLRNPVAVVPNGVDVPAYSSRSRVGLRRRVLFLSRLHPKKGIDSLLRAWSWVQRRHMDWELVIAGPDSLGHRARMQRLAVSLGLSEVIWQDSVQGTEKSALYRSADLFVLPTHAENFGLVVAEALAHGVPVITTKNAPWEGLERERCGWWVEHSDDSLVIALDEAMSLPDVERDTMGARGRGWMVRDFAWPAVARKMHEAYTWVLGGGPPPAFVITD